MMGFILIFKNLAVFILGKCVVHPPTVCTYVHPFVVVIAVELQVTEEERNFSNLIGINSQDGIVGAIELSHDCSEVFVMFKYNDPQINNIDNIHQ